MTDHLRLDLDDYLPYLVHRVGSALAARFTAETLARHDLSIAMWRVLAALSANGEQRQIDLAAMTSIDVSTLSRLVTRLVRRRLAIRRRSKSNSREVVVQLSPAGRALVERLIPVARNLEDTAIAGVSRKDLAVAKRLLRRMHGNMAGQP
ncbi:MAG: MarR family transcriptional regulator [Rhizobiales bacterium]|nr:MarR family transcriptional regulator [Hyphomicrobiales bacterium]